MFRYRVLLVDSEKAYQRPVQAHFMSMVLAKQWAELVLPGATEHAYVQFYRISETETIRVTRKELCGKEKHDQGAKPDLQPAAEETGQPGPAGGGEQ